MHARHRLRSPADFGRVTRDGTRTSAAGLVVYRDAPGRANVSRVGFSVGRGLGTAVVRNRTKRRLREAIGPLLDGLPTCDLVVIARAEAVRASVDELRDALARLLADDRPGSHSTSRA